MSSSRSTGVRRWVMLLALAAIVAPATAQQEVTDQQVGTAIQKAVAYLWGKDDPRHHWEGPPPQPLPAAGSYEYNAGWSQRGGTSCLVLLALLEAGEPSQDDPFQKALKYVAELDSPGNYMRGLRAALMGSLPRDRTDRKLLQEDARYLVRTVRENGMYSYLPPTGQSGWPLKGSGDYSNTQYGVLGTWLAGEAGIEIPDKYWRVIEEGYIAGQNDDGGWGYSPKGSYDSASYGSMSVGGLASLFVVLDQLYCSGVTPPPRGSADPCAFVRNLKLQKAIAKGLLWLNKHFRADENPGKGASALYYYLYGVERVGVASGYKYFNRMDWYRSGAGLLVRSQQDDGSFGGLTNTAWAILFLVRGRAPVIVHKLDYGGDDWNNHPRDLANFTRYVSGAFERRVNWQIVNLDGDPADLHDAPILFLSGTQQHRFTDEQVDKLRRFVLQGGTLLGENSGGSGPFLMTFKSLCLRMFPELEFRPVPPDDVLNGLHFRIRGGPQTIGLHNGVRWLALFLPKGISCSWQRYLVASRKTDFEFGANLYFYCTDKGTLRNKLDSFIVRDQNRPVTATLQLARVQYGGTWQWDPEPLAWQRLGLILRNTRGLDLKITNVPIEKLDPTLHPLAHMTGTAALALSDEQKAKLKAYLAGGGTLLADAAAGKQAFADSFGELLVGLFGAKAVTALPATHPVFGGAKDAAPTAWFRHVDGRPKALLPIGLTGVQLDGRWAVLYSPTDVTVALNGYPCHDAVGLLPEDAEKLTTRALLWASGKNAQAP